MEETVPVRYCSATVELHTDAVKPGDKVLLIDDLIATGGTMMAGKKLLETRRYRHGRRSHRRSAQLGGSKLLQDTGKVAAVYVGGF